MRKVSVEVINTCPCCDEHGRVIEAASAKFADSVDVTNYFVGKDFDCVRKYLPVTRGTMSING